MKQQFILCEWNRIVLPSPEEATEPPARLLGRRQRSAKHVVPLVVVRAAVRRLGQVQGLRQLRSRLLLCLRLMLHCRLQRILRSISFRRGRPGCREVTNIKMIQVINSLHYNWLQRLTSINPWFTWKSCLWRPIQPYPWLPWSSAPRPKPAPIHCCNQFDC